MGISGRDGLSASAATITGAWFFFQIGKWSTKTELEFTVNLGVFLQAIDSVYRGCSFFYTGGKKLHPPSLPANGAAS
jgi:hypothetical protein